MRGDTRTCCKHTLLLTCMHISEGTLANGRTAHAGVAVVYFQSSTHVSRFYFESVVDKQDTE